MRLEGLSVRWETTILPLKGGKNNSNQKNNNYWTKLKQLENKQRDCSSEEEHKENALASGADEGRD